MKKQFAVYIMASKSRVLYVGITNHLERRVQEHKDKQTPGFTKRYNVTFLVYYELCDDPLTAIEREKQIKGWTREKKITLIESANPQWMDLSDNWYDP